jgi:hypothetical protein
MQVSTPDSNDKPRPAVPTVTPKRATGAVDTTVLPEKIYQPLPAFIRCIAAGTGDVLYVDTQQLLAVEIRSENGGVFLVLKDGKVIPVADEYRNIIDRLVTYETQVDQYD